MELYYRDGVDWRKADEIHYRDGVDWRKADEVYYRDTGAWRLVFSGASREQIVITISGTGSIATYTAATYGAFKTPASAPTGGGISCVIGENTSGVVCYITVGHDFAGNPRYNVGRGTFDFTTAYSLSFVANSTASCPMASNTGTIRFAAFSSLTSGSQGILHTSETGLDWTDHGAIGVGTRAPRRGDYYPNEGIWLAAGRNSEVFYSDVDDVTTWNVFTVGDDGDADMVAAMATIDGVQRIVAANESNGIYYTDDFGTTIVASELTEDFKTSDIKYGLIEDVINPGYTIMGFMFCGTDGILRTSQTGIGSAGGSTNARDLWREIVNPSVFGFVGLDFLTYGDNGWLLTSSDDIWSSIDGSSWAKNTIALDDTIGLDVASHKEEYMFVGDTASTGFGPQIRTGQSEGITHIVGLAEYTFTGLESEHLGINLDGEFISGVTAVQATEFLRGLFENGGTIDGFTVTQINSSSFRLVSNNTGDEVFTLTINDPDGTLAVTVMSTDGS